MQYELDLTSYRCPLPLLMTKKALVELQTGDVLKVRISAENGSGDIQLYCRQQGYMFNQSAQGSIIMLQIRR